MIGHHQDKPVLVHWIFPDDKSAEPIYAKLLLHYTEILENIKKEKWNPETFNTFFDNFWSEIDPLIYPLLRIFHDGNIFKRSIAANCFNTALILFYFAKTSNWPPIKARILVRSALLHDVGMLFVPQEILEKQGRVTERERAAIEAHPSTSLDLVTRWKEPPEVLAVAIQHHECWNGSGYPEGIIGKEIHELSRIVSVVINFVAMVTQRTYRNSLVGYLAMKNILDEQGTRFNPEAVRDFIGCLGLNPPGSILLLSDGSIARVIEPRQNNPLRPKVRILIDSSGQEYRNDTGAVIELGLAKKMFITRPVNFQDLMETQPV